MFQHLTTTLYHFQIFYEKFYSKLPHKPFFDIFHQRFYICDVLLFIAISSQYQYLWMEDDPLGNRNSARNSICSQQIGQTKSLLVPDLNNMSNNTRRHSSISHKIVIEFVTAQFDDFSFVLINFSVCFSVISVFNTFLHVASNPVNFAFFWLTFSVPLENLIRLKR